VKLKACPVNVNFHNLHFVFNLIVGLDEGELFTEVLNKVNFWGVLPIVKGVGGMIALW
jgi:hypothetical protein